MKVRDAKLAGGYRRETPQAPPGQSVRPARSVLGLMTGAQTKSDRDSLCRHCHVAPPDSGFSCCAPCRETRRDVARKLRQHRRTNRLCMTCGAAAAPDATYCERHLAYYRSYDRGPRQTIRAERRASRRADGWCVMDGCQNHPAKDGGAYCETHLRWYRDYRRQRAAKETKE